ncbi:hypothetical protein [Kitasatospora sp. NPDC051914]|uniref:hypothetical protein n=1 Tax=Kitasatospora sp. NPDC051914 TaxID=3154945 RepID=UPI003417689F
MKKRVARLMAVTALGFGIIGAVAVNTGASGAWTGPERTTAGQSCPVTTAWGPDGGNPHLSCARAPLS